MTSGIAGEHSGLAGMPTATGAGIFEFALGHGANRFGERVGTLVAERGTHWEYSDPAYAHLSMCFRAVLGCELAEYMERHVFFFHGKVGIRDLTVTGVQTCALPI